MATVTKIWDFRNGNQGWTLAPKGAETGAQDVTNGITVDLFGQNLTAAEDQNTLGYLFSDTYVDVFGVARGDRIVQIGIGGTDYVEWACTIFTTGGTTHNAGKLSGSGKAGASFFGLIGSSANFTTTTSPAQLAFDNTISGGALQNAVGIDTFSLSLWTQISTGASPSAEMQVAYRSLSLTLTYTPSTLVGQYSAIIGGHGATGC